MYEHNALGYRLGLALCLTKVRSSRARCPATALIYFVFVTTSKNLEPCKYTTQTLINMKVLFSIRHIVHKTLTQI